MTIGQKRTTLRKLKEQEVRKESILKAAKEIFFEKGFMAATMDAIADSCGLAKGTLYLYFKSKEELYASIMAEGGELLRKDFDEIAALDLPADRLLAELMKTYFRFYEKNRKYFRIMFLSSQPDLRERVPLELLENCVNHARACMQVVGGVIEKGVESGIFRKVNSWTFANILWSTINGIVMHYEQGPLYRDEIFRLPLKQVLSDALDLALNGLSAKYV